MKSLLLVELLESFSEKEMERLTHFVSCPYFNTDRHIIKLLDVVKKKIARQAGIQDEAKVEIYQKVFSDLPASKKVLNSHQQTVLRVKISTLMQLTEQFLIIEKLKTEAAFKNELLYSQLIDKKQFRLLSRRVNQFRKEPDEEVKDIPYYHYQYKTEAEILNYLYHSAQWIKKDNLTILNRQLDIYYLLSKLKLHVTAVSFMDISAKKQYDFSEMEALQTLLKMPQYTDVPLIRTYQSIIKLKKHKTHEIYIELLDLLDQQEKFISRNDLNDFYVVATNFCVFQIKSGKQEYYRHLFNIYIIMDTKNLLLEGNLIPIGKLKNIISVSCRVEEFEWAINLINKYYLFVRKEIRHHVQNFGFGVIAFHQKDYQTAVDHLYSIDNINLVYDLDRRMMIVKSYYEIESEYKETTAQVFRSMEKYIRGNKLLTLKNKTAYKNFIRILLNLYRIRHRATKMTLERVKEKLEGQRVNSDKKWLLEKIEELEKLKQRRRF